MVRITALILALACVFGVMALSKKPDPVMGGITITNARNDIIQVVEQDGQRGKFKHYPKGVLGENIYVHEYVAPDGIGYQIFEQEMREDGLYERSYGEGVQSKERSYDWRLIEPIKIATST
jgi:hypothetical protein